MKKSLFVVIALIAFGRLGISQTTEKDFRDFAWGSSFSQVKENETAKFISQDTNSLITYDDHLASYDVEVNYQFNEDDKLVSGTYNFTKKHSNPQLYIEDYDIFRNLLTTKYGEPNLKKEEWSSNTTPNDKQNYGQAIADGHLSLYSVWETKRSLIKIILSSSNNRPFLQIHYTTKSLDELENKVELRKALQKL